jgi:hypothetical protein
LAFSVFTGNAGLVPLTATSMRKLLEKQQVGCLHCSAINHRLDA